MTNLSACPAVTGYFTVPAGATADGTTFKLKPFTIQYKPTMVTIRCKNGMVSLGGKRLGPCGKTYRYRVTKSEAELTKLRVTFSDGRPPVQRMVMVGPGKSISFSL